MMSSSLFGRPTLLTPNGTNTETESLAEVQSHFLQVPESMSSRAAKVLRRLIASIQAKGLDHARFEGCRTAFAAVAAFTTNSILSVRSSHVKKGSLKPLEILLVKRLKQLITLGSFETHIANTAATRSRGAFATLL